MATAVENPSIASAKERAASILYGNEKPVTPVIAEYHVPVQEPVKPKPKFAAYRTQDVAPVQRPTQYRAYETVAEPVMQAEPRVIRPFADVHEVVETPVEVVATPVVAAAPVAVTSKQVASEIDVELEEDTQYVVKFKTSTVVTAAVLAGIFVLMAVLFVVNLISLTTAAAEIGTLTQEEQALNQTLNQVIQETEQAKQDAIAAVGNGSSKVNYRISVSPDEIYTPAAAASENGGFFDWLCKSLSRVFG